MKRRINMNKKLIIVVTALALVLLMAIGGTLAYFTDTTENVENTFTMGKVALTLDEAKVGEDGKVIPGEDRVQENDYTNTNMVPGYVYDKDPTIHVDEESEDAYLFLDMTFNKYSSLFWVMAADAAEDPDILLPLYENGALAEGFKEYRQDESFVFSTPKFVEYMVANPADFRTIIDRWFGDIEHEKWQLCNIYTGEEMNGKSDKYMTLRFAYIGDDGVEVAGNDYRFMTTFGMPATVTPKMISDGVDVGGMMNAFNTDAADFNMVFKAYAIQAHDMADLAAAYANMFDDEIGETIPAAE